MNDLASAVITLFLIMDPLGNVPIFLSVLKSVPPERRRKILVREGSHRLFRAAFS
jgi:multiple antibiotic resistance protein